MQPARSSHLDDKTRSLSIRATHLDLNAPRRAEAEDFIRHIFHERYGADVKSFAPNLMLIEEDERIVASAGWRGANSEPLFLERYLDAPIERIIGQRAGIQIDRKRIVEVGNLASDRAGGSLDIILHMARHLHRAGFEWVVFTATQQLIGIFTKLGLPLLALSVADATRLGDAANDWGSYYETQPIVVTGPIRLAIERMRSGA